MPAAGQFRSTLPQSAVLRWLTAGKPDVPLHIRLRLLDEMVGSPIAALAGPISALSINVAAVALHGGVFLVLLGFEITLLLARLALFRRAHRRAARHMTTPPDLYLLLAMAWCAQQGAIGLVCMISGSRPLQIIAGMSFTALIGPICARNYGAPRFAMLLVGLCSVPVVAGTQFLGEPWLLIAVPQTVLLFIGAGIIINRFHDIALSALLAQDHSENQARHDGLTGLLNRLGMTEGLLSYDALRQPFVLLYLDLDGFKPINDRFGHHAGDEVLRAVALRLRACARKIDLVARLGGDEFVIVARAMPSSESERFADRLVRAIMDEPIPLGDDEAVSVGASVGYACAPEDGILLDDLHRSADAALYSAKSAGKGVARRASAHGEPLTGATRQHQGDVSVNVG
jgi:diguanylate cyclase (GGDEF)-like protein